MEESGSNVGKMKGEETEARTEGNHLQVRVLYFPVPSLHRAAMGTTAGVETLTHAGPTGSLVEPHPAGPPWGSGGTRRGLHGGRTNQKGRRERLKEWRVEGGGSIRLARGSSRHPEDSR